MCDNVATGLDASAAGNALVGIAKNHRGGVVTGWEISREGEGCLLDPGGLDGGLKFAVIPGTAVLAVMKSAGKEEIKHDSPS